MNEPFRNPTEEATPWLTRTPDVLASFAQKDDKSGITYRKATIRDAKPFQFAWENRVLLSYVNLLVGVEGIGKGTLVAWIIAHLTQGTLPGNLHGKPCNVAIIGDEDSFENIWTPRIYAAGGDSDRVYFLESGPTGEGIDVSRDAKPLASFVRHQKTRVLYFDQLLDNIGYADSWKDQQVRNALAPLRRVASAENVAVLATMHPNKSRGKNFREILSGTPAFNAVSRSSLLVARHPYERDRIVAVRPKGNYNVEPPGLEFAIEEHSFYNRTGRRGGRTLIKTSRVVDWRDNPTINKDVVLDALAASRRRPESKAGIARALLLQHFADGTARRASEVRDTLLPLHDGLTERILSDAATELGFTKWQEEGVFPTVWWWSPNGTVARRG